MSETVFFDHALEELALHDPTVYHYYTLYRKSHMTKEKMMQELIIKLALDKKTYLELAVDAESRAMPRPIKIKGQL